MTPTEIDRAAVAIHGLRPDWPASSLRTFIMNNLAAYGYRDAVLALAWIATDPNTRKPGRVLEPGPWWDTSRRSTDPLPEPPTPDPAEPRCWVCGITEQAHADLDTRLPGHCPGYTPRKPQIQPAERPDSTRNLNRTSR